MITEGQLRVDPGGPVRVIGAKAQSDAPAEGGKGKLRIRVPVGKAG